MGLYKVTSVMTVGSPDYKSRSEIRAQSLEHVEPALPMAQHTLSWTGGD